VSVDRELLSSVLPAYDIGDVLGAGGWGVVVAGQHRQLDRRVAIKQLPAALAADPEVRRRFTAEARVLASLDHPHVVPVYDFVERDGVCLLLMELLPGGTLRSRVTDAGGITARQAVALSLACASGLSAAHRRGILHRDVKPENMLFAASGVLKVTDFGIAKVIGGADTVLTRAGDVLGTPAYIAPEQVLGGELTPATDVYGLATMLYELLAGVFPFTHEGQAVALLFKHAHGTPRPLRDVAPGVPEQVAAVVMRGLATDPAQRFQTAESFGAELAGAGTQAWGPGWLSAEQVPILDAEPITSAAGSPSAPRAAAPPTIAPGSVTVASLQQSAEKHGQDPAARRRALIVVAVVVAVIVIAIIVLPTLFTVYRLACVARQVLGEGAGHAEPRQDAVVEEAGDGGDAVAVQGQHDEPVGVGDVRLRIEHVAGERRLAVRPGRDEPEPAGAALERHGRQEVRGGVAAAVAEGQRRHAQPGVFRQHRHEGRYVASFPRVGEAGEHLALAGGARQRRLTKVIGAHVQGDRGPRALQRRVDRVRGATEDVRRLRGAKAHHVAEHEGGTLLGRQVLEGGDEGERDRLPCLIACLWSRGAVRQASEQMVGIGLEPDRLVVRRGRGRADRRHRVRRRSRRSVGTALPAAAQRVQALAGRDPVHPGAQRRASLEAVNAAPGSHHRLLQHILGVLNRAENPVTVHLKLGAQGVGELTEGVWVASLCLREQPFGRR
jgi:hypothetical protein